MPNSLLGQLTYRSYLTFLAVALRYIDRTYAATPYVLVKVGYATITHPTYRAFA
jgi:hypothetical protein